MLRSVSFLALASAALSAQADVRYSYSNIFDSVEVTTSTFITSSQTFGPGDVDSASLFLSYFLGATFDPNAVDATSTAVDRLNIEGLLFGVFYFNLEEDFVDGAFGQYGTYTGSNGGTLAVSFVPSSVPGPAAIAPFAIGLVSTLRRRRKSA